MSSKRTYLLPFASDYMHGAYPRILERLTQTNLVPTAGYGLDEFSEMAAAKIREACGVVDADVFFLAGGTQTNACVIDALLRPYQGVVAANTGHIAIHEAGAIEADGHKVLTLPHDQGKITAQGLQELVRAWKDDASRDHVVMPGMCYISQPTEYGTLYSLAELEAIAQVCQVEDLLLYCDGARLAYGLASPENDVALSDLARLCDAFYVGGTKCGALLGEAVVIPQHNLIPHFFSMIKQHGALLAKGRVCALQFDELFSDGLYERIGSHALEMATRIKEALERLGYTQTISSPTNQIFVEVGNEQLKLLQEKVSLSIWETLDENTTVIRLVTCWATTPEDVQDLIAVLEEAA